MSRRVHLLPADDLCNGWSALLPSRVARPALEGAQAFDWVVVGAGYAGIAAARRLAEQQPGASIALVDAGEVGENASGRNSGFAIDLPHSPGTSAALIEQGRRAIRVGRFALDELDHLIKQYNIPCDWDRSGRYHAAVTTKIADQALKNYAANLDKWGEPYEWLDRQALKDRLGTDYYRAAIYTPGTYLMNPAALVRGLADSLPEQVRLFENSTVLEVEFDGASRFVRTQQGRIRFDKLILAVNAFSPSFGVYQDRQVPILLFASLTKPLSPAQQGRLGSDSSWGITPAHSVAGSTLRLTSDKRLLIRHGFEYSPSLRSDEVRRQAAKAAQLRLLQRRFGELGELEIEHFWMGWMAVSRNHAPAFGQVAQHVYAASCCNGSGIVRHTAAGLLIADLALGRHNPLTNDFLAQGTATYIPPRPLQDIGVRLQMMWELARGRAEV